MFYHFSNVVCGVLVCPHVTVILVIISSSLRKFFSRRTGKKSLVSYRCWSGCECGDDGNDKEGMDVGGYWWQWRGVSLWVWERLPAWWRGGGGEEGL